MSLIFQQLKQPQRGHGAGVLAHQHLPWSHPQRQRVTPDTEHESDHLRRLQGSGGESQAGQGTLEGSAAAVHRAPDRCHCWSAPGHLFASHGILRVLLSLCWQVWSIPRPLLWQGEQQNFDTSGKELYFNVCFLQKSDSCKRFCSGVFLSLLVIAVTFGCACAFLTNQYKYNGMTQLPDKVHSTSENPIIYLTLLLTSVGE